MATFNSLNALVKHIENATASSMNEVGEELKKVMQDAVQEEVYDQSPSNNWRTGQLKDKMVEITKTTNDRVEVSITHTGDHISLVKGTRFYVPYGLEGGHTWNRGATNIEECAMGKAEDRIPEAYKKAMKSKGIPIK